MILFFTAFLIAKILIKNVKEQLLFFSLKTDQPEVWGQLNYLETHEDEIKADTLLASILEQIYNILESIG